MKKRCRKKIRQQEVKMDQLIREAYFQNLESEKSISDEEVNEDLKKLWERIDRKKI